MPTPRMMRLAYIAEPKAAGADYVWKMAAIGYASIVIPLAQLVLPRDEPINETFLGLAFVCVFSGIALGIREEWLSRRSGGEHVSGPVLTLLIALNLTAAIVALDLALSSGTGVLRFMLLVPPVIIATIGNRLMFGLVAGSALAGLAMTVFMSTATMPLATQLVTEVAIAALVLVLFRFFAERVTLAFARDTMFGAMSEVAATADSLDEGWNRVLPLVGSYLEAHEVAVARDDGEDELVPLAVWPPHASWSRCLSVAADTIEQAGRTGQATTTLHHTVIPVTSADGLRLVVVATGTRIDATSRMHQEQRAMQVRLQLDLLVNRVRMIEGLELLTRTDSLTGLYNRRALMERLTHETRVAARSSEPLCAVMIDLDHFKRYNDDLGHLEGDRALRAVAQMMAARIRTTDLIGRYGGEEFSIVLPQTDTAGALRLMEELIRRGRSLDLPRRLTFSAGVAQWNGFESVDKLLDRADHALYLAKAAGRDQCRMADLVAPVVPLEGKPVPHG